MRDAENMKARIAYNDALAADTRAKAMVLLCAVEIIRSAEKDDIAVGTLPFRTAVGVDYEGRIGIIL